MNYDENLIQRADYFKALGHPARLLILNLIQMKPRHTEELSDILGLQPATISHHLSKLAAAGILSSEKRQYYQTYSLVKGQLKESILDMVSLPQPGLKATVEEDAYRKKVLKTFFHRGRLKQFPSQLKKRQIILETIVQDFEPSVKYEEIEVNRILVEFNEDVASLRRGLIEMKLMDRKKGVYWRTENEDE